MQSLSWRAGLAGLTRAHLSSGRHVQYPCYIAMCSVRDLPEIARELPPAEVEEALRCYRRVLLFDLNEFSGWKVRRAACLTASCLRCCLVGAKCSLPRKRGAS